MRSAASRREQAIAHAERHLTTFISIRDRLLRLPLADDVIAPSVRKAEETISRLRGELERLKTSTPARVSRAVVK
jgi:hypothetical protein